MLSDLDPELPSLKVDPYNKSLHYNMSIGVPIKLFHEARNHVVSIELKSGESFRGHLVEMDDTMNAVLENVQKTSQDGLVSIHRKVYIRGSQVVFVTVPDMFKHAPMFKRVKGLARVKTEGAMREKARRIREQVITQLAPE